MDGFEKTLATLTVLAKNTFDPFSSRNPHLDQGMVNSSLGCDAPTSTSK